MNDKLEMVVNERNSALESSLSQTTVGNLSAADGHLVPSTTPLRKIKTCECGRLSSFLGMDRRREWNDG